MHRFRLPRRLAFLLRGSSLLVLIATTAIIVASLGRTWTIAQSSTGGAFNVHERRIELLHGCVYYIRSDNTWLPGDLPLLGPWFRGLPSPCWFGLQRGPGYLTVATPLWPMALLAAGSAGWLFNSHRRRPRPGFCHNCGYCLAGLCATVCPECGAPAPPAPLPR